MKVGLLQLNPTVGALEHNTRLLLDAAHLAAERGADLAIAPELALVGYPPRDLLDRPAFLEATARATERVIQLAPSGLTLAFGTVGGIRDRAGRTKGAGGTGALLTNEAIVVRDRVVLARATKQLLPTYDVFDEARYFEPGTASTVFECAGELVFVSICEDGWATAAMPAARYPADPLEEVRTRSATLLVNLSASPFTLDKLHGRPAMFRDIARRHGVKVALVNQVGGNDELVFDGASTVWDAQGDVLGAAPMFESSTTVVDLGGPAIQPANPSIEQSAYEALVVGVRDYIRKCGFSRVVIGLSGGIDSALTAAIAVEALGPDNVTGVGMPTRYSSPGSVEDARQLAENLGIDFHVLKIDAAFQQYIDTLSPVLEHPSVASHAGPADADVTLENVQARIRGASLMAIANRTRALVLTTGNKSELAVGYCTLYGDMVGGLAVLSDLYKTLVYRVSRYVNERHGSERIPTSTIEKPPSAELRPDQLDEDSLPPYDVLDAILERYVERSQGRGAIIESGFDAETVDRVLHLLRISEYKRKQAAPGLIITRKAFGVGWRQPVAQGYHE